MCQEWQQAARRCAGRHMWPKRMHDDRIEQIVVVAVLGLLVAGCVIVLQPFIAALLWAIILSCSTWPAFRWMERRTGGRR